MSLTKEIVTEEAKRLGFDLAGFAKADLLDYEFQALENWLWQNYNSDMKYMERNLEKRRDVRQILPEAKSIISLGMNYYTDVQHQGNISSGKISRYAWGKDYHLIIWEKLDELISSLNKLDVTFEAKSFVDTGPIMDKAWAIRAGIGWMGKHSNIINRQLGSWIFLATLITNYDFDYNEPIQNFCGNCTKCIDACPTNAIVENYVVDSNRCISYLTIENKGEIPEEFDGKFNGWLFGCDICQDVCPWNFKFATETANPEFQPRKGNVEINLEDVLNISQDEFDERFFDSPVSRAKLKGLKRNAEFLLRTINIPESKDEKHS